MINDLVNKKKNKLLSFILTKPFECYKCSAFLFGIVFTAYFNLHFLTPIAAALIMKLYDSHLNIIRI